MAFRSNETSQENRIRAERYLLSNLLDLPKSDYQQSQKTLNKIMNEMGAAVDAYPVWHPFILDKEKWIFCNVPHKNTGYPKIDHTIYFVNGFITSPYNEASNYGQDVIDAINAIPTVHGVVFTAEKLPVTLYNVGTTSILVRCIWPEAESNDGTLSLKAVLPKLLSTALKLYEKQEGVISSEDLLPYLLGSPHGKRSSLFVNQETGHVLKKQWSLLMESGVLQPYFEC